MTYGKWISNENKEKMIKEYKMGVSIKDLANEYGCHVSTIRSILIENDVKIRRNAKAICSTCGEKISRYTAKNNKRQCNKCYEKTIDEEKKRKREEHEKEVKLYETRDCGYGGVCDRLKLHHEILKDDPERLTSDFMIGLICGTEKQERYRSKRGQ